MIANVNTLNTFTIAKDRNKIQNIKDILELFDTQASATLEGVGFPRAHHI